ncbi:hypothetical protein ACHAPJ_000570 [Fusarium lateritium]
MTGTETSNAGGGFDLLRRATQAMMSSVLVIQAWCFFHPVSSCTGLRYPGVPSGLLACPSPSTGAGGGDDDGLAALKLSSFSDASSSQGPVPARAVIPWSTTTPPADGVHLTWKWSRFRRLYSCSPRPESHYWALLGSMCWTAAL